jgi:hypothetical protein
MGSCVREALQVTRCADGTTNVQHGVVLRPVATGILGVLER